MKPTTIVDNIPEQLGNLPSKIGQKTRRARSENSGQIRIFGFIQDLPDLLEISQKQGNFRLGTRVIVG